MSKVFFIGASFFMYACGTSGGGQNAKCSNEKRGGPSKVKNIEKKSKPDRRKPVKDCLITKENPKKEENLGTYFDFLASLLDVQKPEEKNEKPETQIFDEQEMISKYMEKKSRQMPRLYYLDKKDIRYSFRFCSHLGVIKLRVNAKIEDKYQVRNYECSKFVFIEKADGKYIIVLEKEKGYNSEKKEIKKQTHYLFDLYKKESADVIVGKVDKKIFDKIRGALSDYKADLKGEKLSEGYVQYTVMSKPNESEKECEKVRKKPMNAYYRFMKKDDNQRQYEGLLQILEKGFFIKICRKFERELEKCFNYMKEKISINENLAELLQISIEMSEGFSRAEILVNICKYLGYDVSFVSSICANGGYEELKKVFEEFTNEEFLLKCRNLLHKKDEKGNDLLKTKKILDVLLGKGFKYFEDLVIWLESPDNLKKLIEQDEKCEKLPNDCSEEILNGFEEKDEELQKNDLKLIIGGDRIDEEGDDNFGLNCFEESK